MISSDVSIKSSEAPKMCKTNTLPSRTRSWLKLSLVMLTVALGASGMTPAGPPERTIQPLDRPACTVVTAIGIGWTPIMAKA